MERKRKLPARAASRVEHVSKKRNSTPPDVSTTRSTSPSAVASPQPLDQAAQEVPPLSSSSASAALPRSIQPGQPLPTVERPQPDDLSSNDFKSIQESGVMAESLSRSRQKWIHDGVFEKYWAKPTKRKGVIKEESNNPAKETMSKIGQVTITIEPHLLEATMYGVKDTKPVPPGNPAARPIMQYGPPNGAMPPPPKPTTNSTASSMATPSKPPSTMASPSVSSVQAGKPPQLARSKDNEKPPMQQPPVPSAALSSVSPSSQQPELQRPQLLPQLDNTIASPRGLESVLAAPQPPHVPMPGSAHSRPPHPALSQPPLTQPPLSQPSMSQPPLSQPLSQPHTASANPLHAPVASMTPHNLDMPIVPAGPMAVTKVNPAPPKPAASPTSGADPIIVTLAERASGDPHLRDLMKRVAVGEAAAHELAHFQKIIDQITLEYKKKGGQEGPSADRLIVDGRTVKYFAVEVRNILEIVLASNPNQRAKDLRAPPGSDPLVILLVKEALDKPEVKEMIQKVGGGKPNSHDALNLKAILDGLHIDAKQAGKTQQPTAATANPPVASQTTPVQPKVENNSKKSPAPSPSQSHNTSTPQQALRSKGPPPQLRPDITAIVLEFSGGTGDRYLFPRYSILEFSADGTEVVASFLIVRRGSKLEYGGDRTLDFYQPVTLRLHSHAPKALENLTRVVAPQDEVQRYMDDVMENMTRAEYVLLAMRLPRAGKEEPAEDHLEPPKALEALHPPQPPSVLWDSKSTLGRPASTKLASVKPASEDAQYRSFIGTVS